MLENRSVKKLNRQHFAFTRAISQGLDAKESWLRYLSKDGSGADLRLIKAEAQWIRAAIQTSAKREGRPGTARLILIDPAQLTEDDQQPSLEDFIRVNGWDDFSESEQLLAYREAYPTVSGSRGGRSRRVRLIEKQLAALLWIEQRVVPHPKLSDPVDIWMPPLIAGHLVAANIVAIVDLLDFIDKHERKWFLKIRALGASKAEKVTSWLIENADSLGRSPVAALQPRVTVTPATEIRPLETFVIPLELDCSGEGDLEKVRAWVAHQDAAPTRRAYQLCAERLVLWAVLIRQQSITSLQDFDLDEWCQFLKDPPKAWMSEQWCSRKTADWRPLNTPLDAAAITTARTRARSLIEWVAKAATTQAPTTSKVSKMPAANELELYIPQLKDLLRK